MNWWLLVGLVLPGFVMYLVGFFEGRAQGRDEGEAAGFGRCFDAWQAQMDSQWERTRARERANGIDANLDPRSGYER